MGVLQGFKETKKLEKGVKADQLFDATMLCIEEDRSPFFVYIHFMDVHVPCNPPPPYGEMYVSLNPALFEKENFDDDPRGEHYGIGHGHSMFKELLDVPLIFSGMGVPKGRVLRQTRNLDITPTLLGLAGVENTSGRYKGEDVISLLKEIDGDDRLAFSEGIMYGYEKKSLQNARYKYIRCRNCKVAELLSDKKQDPYETVNLANMRPDIKDRMSGLMDELLKGIKQRKAPPALINEETKKQLRSLGYIQ